MKLIKILTWSSKKQQIRTLDEELTLQRARNDSLMHEHSRVLDNILKYSAQAYEKGYKVLFFRDSEEVPYICWHQISGDTHHFKACNLRYINERLSDCVHASLYAVVMHDLENNEFINLTSIDVFPEHRNKGVGTFLMECLKRLCVDMNIPHISGYVTLVDLSSKEKDLLHFYQVKNGFVFFDKTSNNQFPIRYNFPEQPSCQEG